jgi:cyanophycin synthetase
MFDPTRSPGLLRLLKLWERVKAKFARRQPGRAEADRRLSAFYERAWREAAAQLGATVLDLGDNFLEIRLGDEWRRVWHHYSAVNDLVAHHLARTKGTMYRLLAAHGLPSPRHVEFSLADMKPAVAFLESTQRPCVIKPACGTSGGLAVTTGIRTRWQLARAALAVAASGQHPLIEEQVEGANYRLLYLDGELLDVVKREPPSVVADGTSTVWQLVERVNRERLQQQELLSHAQLTTDCDFRMTLGRQGLSPGSVPASGTVVRFKTVINENSSLENVTARDELCAEILEEAARAVELSGLRLAGVDIIAADPTRSLHTGGGVILEVNSPPGFFWHYHKRDGSFPVALHVLRALFGRTGAPNRNGCPEVARPALTT